MIDNELQVRLLHAAKTQDGWKAVTSYPKKGEVCLESINSSGATAFKIKIGDGTRKYCRYDENTATWDFTSDQVLPYFGNVITASGVLQVLAPYTYPNDYSTEALRNVTVMRAYQLSLVTSAGETTLSVDTSNYNEIRAGSKLNFSTFTIGTNTDNVSISHDQITTDVTDNSLEPPDGLGDGERESYVITDVTTDSYGHITAYTKDKSTNLVAADITGKVDQSNTDTWRYRITGDTVSINEDTASLNKLDGNTIVWNQICPTVEITDMTANRSSSQFAYAIPVNHKIYVSFEVKKTSDYVQTTERLTVDLARGGDTFGESVSFYTTPSDGVYHRVTAILTSLNSLNNSYFFRSGSPSSGSLSFKNVVAIDLTFMFGETIANSMTVEAFEKLFPLPYYAYNEGQLLNVNVNGLKTVGFNLYNNGTANVIKGETYYVDGTPTSLAYDDGTLITLSDKKFTANKTGVITVTGGSADTIINLSDTSRNGTYEPYWSDTTSVPITGITGISSATGLREVIFPDGLKSAGAIKDSIEGSIAYKRLIIRDYTSSDESDSSVITDGTHTVVPLTTAVTYTNLQYPDGRTFELPINYRVDDLGTEEWLPEQTSSTLINYPEATIIYRSNFKNAVLDTIDKVNNYKNPVQGEFGNEPQTVGKVAVYDTTHSTESSNYSISNSTINPSGTSNNTIIPTVNAVVNYVEDNTVQEIETDDDDNSNPTGLTVTHDGSTWNVSHQTIDTEDEGYIVDDGANIEGEEIVDLVTDVEVDDFGHITNKHIISSDKIIAADIKAPVIKPDNNTWNYRETGGDITIGEDTAKIPSLKGNTVVWNQLWDNTNVFNNSSVSDNLVTSDPVPVNVTIKSFECNSSNLHSKISVVTGHKYYFCIKIKSSVANNIKFYTFASSDICTSNEISLNTTLSKHANVITAVNTGDITSFQFRYQGAANPTEFYYQWDNRFNLIDLTKLFGSDANAAAALGVSDLTTGDNPSIAATNFEKLFPNSYYPYCEGRLVNLGGYGVKWNQLYDTTVPTAETDHKYYLSEVVSSTKTSSISTTISYTSGSTNRMCIDLTMMFGPGSEPTLEEFEAIFPKEYYEYNAGTEMNIFDVIGNKKLGLISTGNIPDDSEPHAVDMGLPSGLLWADSNIDVTQKDGFAASPYQYGCTMFSWGNVEGHNTPTTGATFDYNWGSVNSQEPWYDGQVYGNTPGNSLTADIVTHNASQDAAYRNVGAPWHMPSSAEFKELIDNCDFIDANGNIITGTNKLTKVSNAVGIYLRSKINGNILFFACSGYGNGSSWGAYGIFGLYWASSFYSSRYARALYFRDSGIYPQELFQRYSGYAIRAVRQKKQTLDLDWIREIEYTPSGSSTPEKLFPYGLLSAGSVHDEVTETKAIKRVGVVDLGSLVWSLVTDGIFSTSGTFIKNYGSSVAANILSIKFTTIAFSDGMYSGAIALTGGGNIYIGINYSTVSEVESALQGVLLYYELATPVEIPLAEPHIMSYAVDDHGTEQQLPINVSSVINAPFRGTFEYMSNFKDTVIELIDKVNAYKNPVKGINDTEQSVGKLAIYDSSTTVASSSHFVDLDATIETGDTIHRLPTVQQMIDYVTESQANALQYKGTVSSYDGNNSVTSKVTEDIQSGWLYFIDTQFTLDEDEDYLPAGTYNIGDFIVWNDASNAFDVIRGVHNIQDVTTPISFNLSEGETSYHVNVVSKVDGVDIKVRTPNLNFQSPSVPADDPLNPGSNESIEFIDTASQSNGLLNATKKKVRNASTSQTGVVQLSNSISGATSTSTKVPTDYEVQQALGDYIPLTGSDEITGSLTPDTPEAGESTPDLGSSTNKWNHVYSNTLHTSKINNLSDYQLVLGNGTGVSLNSSSNQLLISSYTGNPAAATSPLWTNFTFPSTGNKILKYVGGTGTGTGWQLDSVENAFGNVSPNYVFAGPASGQATIPSFRKLNLQELGSTEDNAAGTTGKGYLKRVVVTPQSGSTPAVYDWEFDPYGGGSLKPSYANDSYVEASEDRATQPSAPNAGLKEQTGTSTYKHYKIPFSAIENDPSTGNNTVVIILNGNFS